MKILEFTRADSSRNRQRLATLGDAMVVFELAFPLIIFTIAKVHYAVAARGFSGRFIGYMQLFWFLVCCSCIVSLIFSSRGSGWKRFAGVVGSMMAGILNVIFLALNSLV